MHSKFNQIITPAQNNALPAGLLRGDYNTELFGDPETRKMHALSNGNRVAFAYAHPIVKLSVKKQLQSDAVAMFDLAHLPEEEALEEYAFCLYGALNATPDFDETGVPVVSENFLCGTDCRCVKWPSKKITLNGTAITERQIIILRLLANDMPDKAVADTLSITQSTLDHHKRTLMSIAGVFSKTSLVKKALTENIV